MRQFKTLLILALLIMMTHTPVVHAESYRSAVAHKFVRGTANLFTGVGEIPRNIAYVSDKTNPLIGVTGGLVMGVLNTVGRTATGVFDIVTSPIPSKSLLQPEYVWSDLEKSTLYGMQHSAKSSKTISKANKKTGIAPTAFKRPVQRFNP